MLFIMCLLSFCVSLSLLEGGANGIDDTATQFAEVNLALQNFGSAVWVMSLVDCSHFICFD